MLLLYPVSPTTISGVEFKDFESSNIVWKHFLRSTDRQSAKCKLCPVIIKTSGRSTSGLHTHLRTKHGIVAKNVNSDEI